MVSLVVSSLLDELLCIRVAFKSVSICFRPLESYIDSSGELKQPQSQDVSSYQQFSAISCSRSKDMLSDQKQTPGNDDGSPSLQYGIKIVSQNKR